MSLSLRGDMLIARCPYCQHEREEQADPAKNPNPFIFIAHCVGCGRWLDIDHDRVDALIAQWLLTHGTKDAGGRA